MRPVSSSGEPTESVTALVAWLTGTEVKRSQSDALFHRICTHPARRTALRSTVTTRRKAPNVPTFAAPVEGTPSAGVVPWAAVRRLLILRHGQSQWNSEGR